MRGVVAAVLIIVLAACTGGIERGADGADPTVASPPPVEAAPTEPGPDTIAFHLDVSNQSFDEPEVRLRIWLDGTPIIDDVFPVKDQHHVVRHDLHLESGSHNVRVAESGTDFELNETFTLEDESWANVSYWGSSGNGPRLAWHFSRERLEYG